MKLRHTGADPRYVAALGRRVEPGEEFDTVTEEVGFALLAQPHFARADKPSRARGKETRTDAEAGA